MADIDDLKAAEAALEAEVDGAINDIASLHVQLDAAVASGNMDQIKVITASMGAATARLRAARGPAPASAPETSSTAPSEGSTKAA